MSDDLVHLEPMPIGPGHHADSEFTFELEEVTCEACRAGVVAAVRADRPSDRQVWEKRLGGTDVAEKRMHLEVDHEGRVRIHEALVVQMLVDAGWERTA